MGNSFFGQRSFLGDLNQTPIHPVWLFFRVLTISYFQSCFQSITQKTNQKIHSASSADKHGDLARYRAMLRGIVIKRGEQFEMKMFLILVFSPTWKTDQKITHCADIYGDLAWVAWSVVAPLWLEPGTELRREGLLLLWNAFDRFLHNLPRVEKLIPTHLHDF